MNDLAANRLRQLVPAIYRNRDLALPGQPLDRLLGLFGEELDSLRLAIRALGDDRFVERASPDALMLLADLYGARLLGRDPRVNRGVLARSIAWRRRRGTLPVLEEVLAITSGWGAEVDEAYRSLAHTQEFSNLLLNRGRTAVLWDPIATADPLSRNAPAVQLPPRGALPPEVLVGRAEDETLDEALRRLGRADAGRHAALPRSLDLVGWARPETAVIRTARLSPLEIEGVEPGPAVRVQTASPSAELTGFRLDPLDRDQPLVWLQPHERPDDLPTLTEIHEPAPDFEPEPRRVATLLTPTALAENGDLAESQGALEIRLDGIQLIGRKHSPKPRAALEFEPLGPRPVLRFADPLRPGPGDDWGIKLIAHQAAGDRVMAATGATRGQVAPLSLGDGAHAELEYDLDLMHVNRADELVDEGLSLVIVALVDTDLHIRIFDASGEKVIDKAENELVHGEQLTALKQRLRHFPDVSRLSQKDKPEIIRNATSILRGATVRLRLRRYAGTGRLRAGDGSWSPLGNGARLGPPLGPAVAVQAQGNQTLIYRAELHEATDALRLTRLPLAAPVWEPLALTGDLPAPERGVLLAVTGEDLLMVIPERDADASLTDMGLYLVEPDGTTAAVTRRVAAPELKPPARTRGSIVLRDGRLYLFGGSDSGGILDDLWSIAVDGSEPGWTPHPVRNPQSRSGASLLSTPAGLLLIGGEAAAGGLGLDCWLLDVTQPRPRWVELPALPFDSGRPGTLIAHHDGVGTEALVWADHTRPRLCRLEGGVADWTVGAAEPSAPNPPAPGEGIFDGAGFLVAGPAPLPMSEVILSLGGTSLLAVLPALDLVPQALNTGEQLVDDETANPGLSPDAFASFELATDGSSWRTGADDLALHTRPGGALHASLGARLADRPRIGVPERLARHFFQLRQRSLGVWDQPYVPPHADLVGLDPRLGRVLLPRGVQDGRLEVSYRVGRGAAIGAGMLPPDHALPDHWQEPDAPAPTPPDLRPDRGPAGPSFSAWIDPRRAGQSLPSGGTRVPLFGDLESAVSAGVPADGTGAPVIGMLRSAQVPAARITEGLDQGLSILATDFGSTPMIRADAVRGSALALHPDHAGSAATDIWLAGLWLGGRLDLAMSRGEVDLRWCTLGNPGELAIRLPGAGHQGLLTRRTLPDATLELRLYGCVVGAVRIPPWVRLIAAGCTFDAGSRAGVAIQAFGADVRLRHCTLHGGVDAGELRGSSCAFAGEVRVDRSDRGWLRHSLIAGSGRTPQRYRCLESHVALASTRPTDPRYLVLAESNGVPALAAGELGRLPGAHSERRGRLRELEARTADFLPIGMVAHQIDRSTQDLNRMARTRRRSL